MPHLHSVSRLRISATNLKPHLVRILEGSLARHREFLVHLPIRYLAGQQPKGKAAVRGLHDIFLEHSGPRQVPKRILRPITCASSDEDPEDGLLRARAMEGLLLPAFTVLPRYPSPAATQED
jgi:hypothetical protein